MLADLLLSEASAYDEGYGLGIRNCPNDYTAWRSRGSDRVGRILMEARRELIVLQRSGMKEGDNMSLFLDRFAATCGQTGAGHDMSERVQKVQLLCLQDLDKLDGPTAIQRLMSITQILGT